MTSYKKLFTGKYLASDDLGDAEPTVRIERMASETVVDEEKQTSRVRWIALFEGKAKGMLLNRTNAILIAAIVGSDEIENWIGHAITIGVRDVKLGGQTVPGLRVIGSPELDKPRKVMIKMPRKKPMETILQPTGGKQSAKPAPAPAPEPPQDDGRNGWGTVPRPATDEAKGDDL